MDSVSFLDFVMPCKLAEDNSACNMFVECPNRKLKAGTTSGIWKPICDICFLHFR